MFLVKPSFRMMFPVALLEGTSMLQEIERAGRTCYKSEDRITEGSAEQFVARLLKSGHHSVIEHVGARVRIVCDRGVTHELVRHRLASYSQESTRYCDYMDQVTFVIPPWVRLDPGEYGSQNLVDLEHRFLEMGLADGERFWALAMCDAERAYKDLRERGWSPQYARGVLPNATKTEIVMTANLREWRHVFSLRASTAAHPQMEEIMTPLLREFSRIIPVVFDDLVEGLE